MSVASVISNAASKITGAISQAARSTGISFEYLVTTAQIESRLNPKAQAPTSSASGLYQFIDQTWLGTLKKAGASLGLGQYADAISKTADGHYTVDDPNMRTEIMQLRHDPSASALMAGAFTRNNETQLASVIGRQPSEGELYIAHFLGSGGAGKLISAAADQPQANAAKMFPHAAGANRSVFYDRSGHTRSVAGVYGELNRRYQMARNTAFNMGLLRGTIDAQTGATCKLASIAALHLGVRAAGRLARRQRDRGACGLAAGGRRSGARGAGDRRHARHDSGDAAAAPDPAGATQVIAAATQAVAAHSQNAAAGEQRSLPFFRTMFNDRAGAPVTPAVQRLWATTRSAEASQAAAKAAAAQGQLNPLDLFVDHPRNSQSLFGSKKA